MKKHHFVISVFRKRGSGQSGRALPVLNIAAQYVCSYTQITVFLIIYCVSV